MNVRVGRILKAHGVAGEVIVAAESDSPGRFVAGASFLTEGPALTIRTVRPHRGALLATFEGITDRNAADALRDTVLYIPSDARRSLGDDEFWPEDLEGLEVRDAQGRPLATITEVIVGDAQDRLVMQTESGIVEIPFVKELVPEVHLASGFVTINPIAGLFSSEPD